MFLFKRKRNNGQKLENIMEKLQEIERKLQIFQEQNRDHNDSIIKEKLEKLNHLFKNDKQRSVKNHADPLLPHIASIEKQIFQLSNKINDSYKIPADYDPIIIIENLHVENIVVDKMDYANNIGQLGVKDLSGKLNIGTSYDGRTPKSLLKKQKESEEKLKKVQMRPRKETEEEKV